MPAKVVAIETPPQSNLIRACDLPKGELGLIVSGTCQVGSVVKRIGFTTGSYRIVCLDGTAVWTPQCYPFERIMVRKLVKGERVIIEVQ